MNLEKESMAELTLTRRENGIKLSKLKFLHRDLQIPHFLKLSDGKGWRFSLKLSNNSDSIRIRPN